MNQWSGRWQGSRREALRLGAGGALGVLAMRGSLREALAQATPAAGAYPELGITITDAAFALSATEVPAGYVLLTVVNQASDESQAGLVGPGSGQTMQDLVQAAATPSPADAFVPPFFYTATLPGGPGSIAPGATAQAVVQLTAGDWAVWGGSETSNPAPAFLKATGGGGGSQNPPAATVTITEVDFAFGGFGVAIPAGKQTWQVVNQGTQPHMLSISQVPAGTTLAQVMTSIAQPGDASPTAGQLGRNDFVDRGGVILQSPGTTVWPMLDLPAGRYAALCFMTDPVHGMIPHAMEGMVAVFDVGAAS